LYNGIEKLGFMTFNQLYSSSLQQFSIFWKLLLFSCK